MAAELKLGDAVEIIWSTYSAMVGKTGVVVEIGYLVMGDTPRYLVQMDEDETERRWFATHRLRPLGNKVISIPGVGEVTLKPRRRPISVGIDK